MRKVITRLSGAVLLIMLVFGIAVASSGSEHNFGPHILLGLAIMLVSAKIVGELFERISQPAVLGELLAGILLGNLTLFGVSGGLEWLKTDTVIAALAEIGVILLLFEVGLESSVAEMLEVGWSSLLVAVLGVIAPFFLGWTVSAYFLPNTSRLVHIFVGSVLCATSVGITARVLKDLGKLKLREARIILGAAVIDDVVGLLILATVVGAVSATAAGSSLSIASIAWLAGKAVIFFAGAFVLGRYVVPPLFRGAGKFESRGVLLVLSIAICFLLSWIAAKAELATIVGAFAAGLILEEVHFKSFMARGERNLHQLLEPVNTFLVPIFFVVMGLKVDLRVFAELKLIGFAIALTIAAIVGKQVCSLGVTERRLNRVAIGIGMIPRGEVGLIVAGIGASLFLPNATGTLEPVIRPETYGAVVIMVLATTLLTPPLLKASLSRKNKH